MLLIKFLPVKIDLKQFEDVFEKFTKIFLKFWWEEEQQRKKKGMFTTAYFLWKKIKQIYSGKVNS